MHNKEFKDKVYEVVAIIPFGKVMTYGDVAALAGHAYAARSVGGIAHYGPQELPWHRIVNRFGGLAAGFPGGRERHKSELEAENIRVDDDYIIINFQNHKWQP